MGDWQPGDLVLCVRGGEIACPHSDGIHTGDDFPNSGVIDAVDSVGFDEMDDGTHCGCIALFFKSGRAGVASRFVKITPGTEPEGIEEPRRVPPKEFV